MPQPWEGRTDAAEPELNMHSISHERLARLRRTSEAPAGGNSSRSRSLRHRAPRREPLLPTGQELSFAFATDEDAEGFRCAFYRFVEIKCRAFTDPRSGCSIEIRRKGARRVAEVELWSRSAAEEFARFWPRYAQAYGSAALIAEGALNS